MRAPSGKDFSDPHLILIILGFYTQSIDVSLGRILERGIL